MSRVHAFEFNERSWCPRFVRDSIVEALGRGLRWGRIYDPVGPVFAQFCREARAERALDLCSGTAEPVSILIEAVGRAGVAAPSFAVSDLFPNVPAMESVAARHLGKVEIVREPVDATDVPAAIDRPARTVVSAFHHFEPDLARRILADSVAKRRAIFILEGFPRRLARLVAIMPAMTAAALVNPFVTRRDRLLKLIFTFVVPIVPIAGLWDAVVSVLRVHSESELRAMVEPLGGGYRWEYFEVPFFPLGRATVFYGVPPS